MSRSTETWAPYQGRIRPSMQREESPAMATGLERIAAKARSEPKLRFTSLAHHITKGRVWENLCQIRTSSAPGVDGQTVPEAKESFGEWIEPMLQSIHRQGYQAPSIRRVYIPKPGKKEKRPLGVPCVAHEWMLRFVEHRVGDPRLISLIRRWLKANVLEDEELHPSEEGTPQGGSISVLLSNLYLHYVLDLWFERVVKPRLRGEAYLV